MADGLCQSLGLVGPDQYDVFALDEFGQDHRRMRGDDRHAVGQRGVQGAMEERDTAAEGQNAGIGGCKVGRDLLGSHVAGPLNTLFQVQFGDQILHLRQVGHVRRVAGARLAADHQQPGVAGASRVGREVIQSTQ